MWWHASHFARRRVVPFQIVCLQAAGDVVGKLSSDGVEICWSSGRKWVKRSLLQLTVVAPDMLVPPRQDTPPRVPTQDGRDIHVSLPGSSDASGARPPAPAPRQPRLQPRRPVPRPSTAPAPAQPRSASAPKPGRLVLRISTGELPPGATLDGPSSGGVEQVSQRSTARSPSSRTPSSLDPVVAQKLRSWMRDHRDSTTPDPRKSKSTMMTMLLSGVTPAVPTRRYRKKRENLADLLG